MKLDQYVKNSILAQVTNKQSSSFYLYKPSIMESKIQNLRSVMPESLQIYYAMKANPHQEFLKAALNSKVQGIEVASLGEGEQAIRAGFNFDQIIFTGPGKSPEELSWSVKNKIKTVHIESVTEAFRLNNICEQFGTTQDILLRVNPNFSIHDSQAKFSGGSVKLGVDEEKLDSVISLLKPLKNLNFKGLHVYAASGVLNVNDLLMNCELVFKMVHKIESTYNDMYCHIIDFGGGFGIDYLEKGNNFSPEDYALGLKKLISMYNLVNREFILELGRYLCADSGWYCTEILDIKESRGVKQVICAGGTNHFRRPAALSINHPVEIIPINQPIIFDEQESVDNEYCFIGGPLCNTADKIANNVYISNARIGDIAVFGLAGAYGLTMSHINFLSHKLPEEIII